MIKFIDFGICVFKINHASGVFTTLDVYVTPGCSPCGINIYEADRVDLIHALGGKVEGGTDVRQMVAEDL